MTRKTRNNAELPRTKSNHIRKIYCLFSSQHLIRCIFSSMINMIISFLVSEIPIIVNNEESAAIVFECNVPYMFLSMKITKYCQ